MQAEAQRAERLAATVASLQEAAHRERHMRKHSEKQLRQLEVGGWWVRGVGEEIGGVGGVGGVGVKRAEQYMTRTVTAQHSWGAAGGLGPVVGSTGSWL